MIEKGKEEVEGEAHMTMLVSISIMETPLLRCTRKSELTEGGGLKGMGGEEKGRERGGGTGKGREREREGRWGEKRPSPQVFL